MNEQITLTKDDVQELLEMINGKEFKANNNDLSIKLQSLLAEMNSIGLVNIANNFNDVKFDKKG